MRIDNALTQQFIIDNIHWRVSSAIQFEEIKSAIKESDFNSFFDDSNSLNSHFNYPFVELSDAQVNPLTGMLSCPVTPRLAPWATTIKKDYRIIIYKYDIVAFIHHSNEQVITQRQLTPSREQ